MLAANRRFKKTDGLHFAKMKTRGRSHRKIFKDEAEFQYRRGGRGRRAIGAANLSCHAVRPMRGEADSDVEETSFKRFHKPPPSIAKGNLFFKGEVPSVTVLIHRITSHPQEQNPPVN